jgi:hypothetical protein
MFPKSCNIHNIIDTFNKEFMKLITSNIVACVHRPIVARVQLSHASHCRPRPIIARPGCGDQFSRVQFSASNCRDTEKGKENECQMSKF